MDSAYLDLLIDSSARIRNILIKLLVCSRNDDNGKCDEKYWKASGYPKFRHSIQMKISKGSTGL